MNTLANKNLILGITGGISAYKSADLASKLRQNGANVRVIMTADATRFITPLSLQALTHHPVYTDIWNDGSDHGMAHISLAKWADFILVAPATADFIAKYRAGLANNLLLTTLLASTTPVAIAPAMNKTMWEAAATQENIHALCERGVAIWGPDVGLQACGDEGAGRLLEPEELLTRCQQYGQENQQRLKGKHVLLTAGPTRESIDPVRFLSNHSSGKMGYAIAIAARDLGADVHLVSGPVSLPPPPGVSVTPVISASEMHQAVMENLPGTDIFIGCAAVSDYTLAQPAPQKIKKQSDSLQLTLQKTPDILAEVAQNKNRPFTVGFAAETEHLADYAQTKLQQKKLDLIAANLVNQGQGMNKDNNCLTVFSKTESFPLGDHAKPFLAKKLMALVATQYLARQAC